MVALSERKANNDDVSGHTPPVGAIMAYMPGYYTAAGNSGFTTSGIGGNTVNDANTFLPDNWRVCDGTALNDPESPIWNTAGRHLPELTDSRFIRGSTASGVAAGANSKSLNTPQLPAHAHPGASTAADVPHSHTASAPTTNAPHGHPGGAPNPTVNAPANAPHSHPVWVSISGAGTPSGFANSIRADRSSAFTPSSPGLGNAPGVNAPHNQPHSHPSGAVPAYNAPHSHNVPITTNNAPHSHTVTVGNTGSGDTFDIQPNYISVFYIIRIK